MTRGVKDGKFAGAQRQRLTPFENLEILLGHRERFPKKLMQGLRPESGGTGEQLGRIDHMRCAQLVYVNLKARIFFDQRPCRACVVEMDMSEENRIQISDRKSLGTQLLAKSGDSGCWTGIDD